MTEKAHITPSVLRWARLKAMISRKNAAKRTRVSVERYDTWENGINFPTIRQAKILAKYFEKPLSVFFLPKIPKKNRIMSLFIAKKNIERLLKIAKHYKSELSEYDKKEIKLIDDYITHLNCRIKRLD